MWKWIAILTGIACAAFFAVGFIKPEVHIVNSVHVHRSPDVVWKVFTDMSRSKEWLTGLNSMERISGEHLAVGTRSKLVFFDGGRREEMEETTTAVEPGKLYAFDSSMDMMSGSTSVRLTPNGAGTDLTFDSTYAGKTFLWRSALALMQSSVEKRGAEDMGKLKALVEAEPR
jgi:carbon monoxide dehydrogenase subunit G